MPLNKCLPPSHLENLSDLLRTCMSVCPPSTHHFFIPFYIYSLKSKCGLQLSTEHNCANHFMVSLLYFHFNRLKTKICSIYLVFLQWHESSFLGKKQVKFNMSPCIKQALPWQDCLYNSFIVNPNITRGSWCSIFFFSLPYYLS